MRPATAAIQATRRMNRGGAAMPVLLAVLGFILLAILLPAHVQQGYGNSGLGGVLSALFDRAGGAERAVLVHMHLPRAAAALLAGAALAVSGVLLQAVTRNPMASPSLLGVSAGAHLALILAIAVFPALAAVAPLAVAFAGGLAAAMMTYAVAGGLKATPVRLVLAGMAVSLAVGAVSALLAILIDNDLSGLFLWGAGSLVQLDWTGSADALPRIAVGIALALLMGRALDVLSLGDDVAQSLGQGVGRVRLAGAGVATLLAAAAVCLSGPIAFIGLITPNLLRLAGVTRHRPLMLLAALWGGVLLLAADTSALALSSGRWPVPAGVIAALIGAPMLILLVRRTGRLDRAATRGGTAGGGRALPFPLLLALGAAALPLVALLGLSAGSNGLSPALLARVLSEPGPADLAVLGLRLPRTLIAMLVGAMLASSGLLFQGVVRNPLAGPELIGVNQSAGLVALLALLVLPGLPMIGLQAAALLGGGIAFAVILGVSGRAGMTPARVALAGLGFGALCAALSSLIVSVAGLQVAQALVWLAGTTYARGWADLAGLLPWAVLLLPAAWLVGRWLDLISLGDDAARALGLPLDRARALVAAIGVAVSAAAVSVVGPVAFVGLMAPHGARLICRGGHRRLLVVAAILGAVLLGLADVVGRTLLAPVEIPVGLVTAMLGAPYILLALWRAQPRRASR